MNQAGLDDRFAERRSSRSYTTGAALSLILTAIPIIAVISSVVSRTILRVIIFGAAAIQILGHLVYFIHRSIAATSRWNQLTSLFVLPVNTLFQRHDFDHAPSALPHFVRRLKVVRNYVLVTKPGIIFGNLITTAGAFFLASGNSPSIALLLPTIAGVALVIASACVFNNYIDRDLDRKMVRTHNRVLARGLMSSPVALSYASLLGFVGMAVLCSTTNLLCVAIVLAGFTIYVGVYSVYMKRSLPCAPLVGSLAGAAPPLAGYCAVSNCFDMEAAILFLIFSLWQIPHWYAIAIFRHNDYAAAAIPIVVLKQGVARTKKQIICLIVPFTAASLIPGFAGYTGYAYMIVTAACGLSWLYLAWSGRKTSDSRHWAKQQFGFSVITIFIISIMMSVTELVR